MQIEAVNNYASFDTDGRLKMTPVRMSAESHIGEEKQETPIKTFGEYLAESLSNVDRLQKESDEMNAKLAAGELEDISQAVIASEKADIALQLTLQMRNKAIDAYQEIMRMQV